MYVCSFYFYKKEDIIYSKCGIEIFRSWFCYLNDARNYDVHPFFLTLICGEYYTVM